MFSPLSLSLAAAPSRPPCLVAFSRKLADGGPMGSAFWPATAHARWSNTVNVHKREVQCRPIRCMALHNLEALQWQQLCCPLLGWLAPRVCAHCTRAWRAACPIHRCIHQNHTFWGAQAQIMLHFPLVCPGKIKNLPVFPALRFALRFRSLCAIKRTPNMKHKGQSM